MRFEKSSSPGTSDFVMLMDSATFSDSSTEACYNILVTDDNTIEPQELFYVVLTLLSDSLQSLVNISPDRSSVLIIDNDGKIQSSVLCLMISEVIL